MKKKDGERNKRGDIVIYITKKLWEEFCILGYKRNCMCHLFRKRIAMLVKLVKKCNESYIHAIVSSRVSQN